MNEVVPLKEMQKLKFFSVPDPKTWKIDPNGAYFSYCDNETISGLEFHYIPDSKG